ncbi:TnsA-like heteromeric transposase endonuclease subunit [Deinococcus sp. SM5_A1]|uniref:TnsA-like heteromeric transposase endonuclease subunit n=1 Tax=Deinococcus sp. SM5_A1 TaxID=3379094 RepID=UPI00385C685D
MVREIWRRTVPLVGLGSTDPNDLTPVKIIFEGGPGAKTRTVGGERRPANYQGQTAIGGTYWFTRADRRLPYSSGLERLRMQYADLDPATLGACSHPFAMLFQNGEQQVLHLPDLLLRRRNRPHLLVDVRPWCLQHGPKSRLSFALTRAAAAAAGMDYEVWGEPPATEAFNVRFLSGYRTAPVGFEEAAAALVPLALAEPYTVGELIDACPTPRHFIFPALFHLLWRGDLAIDLTRPLRSTSLILPGPAPHPLVRP